MTHKTQVDAGYAWVVLASCFVLCFFVNAFWSIVGMLMIQWQASYDVSASQTAVTATLFVVIMYVTSPVSSALGNRLTYRVTVIGAGCLVWSSLLAASFVPQFGYLYFIVPIIGIGLGIVYHTSSSFYDHYFDKHFAFANGLFNISPAIGVVSVPPLMKESFTYFGFVGTLQLMSAIFANICVCGALLRPTKCKKSKQKQRQLTEQHIKNVKNTDNNCCSRLKDIAKDFDLGLFRSTRFIFQSVLNGVLYGGFVSPIVYIVPYAESVGITDIKSPLLMSSVAASSIVARLVPLGYLVDRQVVSAASLTVAAAALSATAIIVFTFTKTFLGLALFAGVYGIGWGISSTFLIIIVAYSGGSKEKSSGAIAWTLLGRGVGGFMCIYGGGVLRDKFDSYQPSLILGGVFGLGLAINVLSDPLIQRWKLRQLQIGRKPPKAAEYSSITDVKASSAV